MGAVKRIRRHCKRCDRGRIFEVRIRPNGHRQSDCVACRRRRGRERTPTKVTYRCMLDRCLNENAVNYQYYGGRGVQVCGGIVCSYELFVEVVGERPAHKTLDRIDVDGHYSCGRCAECKAKLWPMNLRWATAKEQIENRRKDGTVVRRHVTYGTHKKKNYQQAKGDE